MKKLISFGVGIALFATPLLVSAQTVAASSNATLIAVLTQLVQVLEQELQQLIAVRGGSTTPTQPTNSNSSVNFAVSSASGVAPLTVTFSAVESTSAGYLSYINFGDSSTGAFVANGGCAPNYYKCTLTHTYTSAGTYTAELYNTTGKVIGTVLVTVAGNNSTQPSVTIDQSSLTSSSGYPMITGTVLGANVICAVISATSLPQAYENVTAAQWSTCSDNQTSQVTIANGRWSFQPFGNYSSPKSPTPLVNGTYNVGLYDENIGNLLTSGTLMVQ